MASEDGVLLDFVLRPSPPLSARVLLGIVGLVALAHFCVADYFVARGAWPVVPFMVVNVLLLTWAFHACRIAARSEEHVTLTRGLLRVTHRPPRGEGDTVEFNPYWLRVEIDEPAKHLSQLTVWSHGKGLRIGAFLAPDERAAFARTLKSALRQARETTF